LQRSSRSGAEETEEKQIKQPRTFMYEAFRKHGNEQIQKQSVFLAKVFYLLDHKVSIQS